MILAYIYKIETAQVLLQNAAALAVKLKKDFGIVTFVSHDEETTEKEAEIKESLVLLKLEIAVNVVVRSGKMSDFAPICDELEASFLLVQMEQASSKTIRNLLNASRDLRIPYVLHKDTFGELNFQKVLVPIGFLEEELEKAQFASAFGRFCGSHIHLLLANDSGSKAARNADKMKSLFDQFQLKYTESKAKGDSFKVDKESVSVAENEQYGLIIVSASRDYGLDDIIFGSKEMHVVKQSQIPVMLVNPRGDLYALCD